MLSRAVGWFWVSWLGAVGIAAGQAPVAPVRMAEEPHHHLVFENETVRIFQPRIPSGESTLEHLHTEDDLTICISGSSMRTHGPGADWGRAGQPCTPGQVSVGEYAGKRSSHVVQNAGSGTFQLVAIDNVKESGWSTNPPLAAPATTVIRETRAFQAYDVRLDAHTRETTHLHTRPTVVVLISGEVRTADKTLRQPGDWALIPAQAPHVLSTPGQAQVVEVELR